MMGVSRREYARLRGVSESAVRKAIATGRITVEADGTIDPERADREWAARTDPAQQRGGEARRPAAAAEAAAPPGTRPVPQAAFEAVREALHEAGRDVAPGEAGGAEVSYHKARLANEVLKAQLRRLELGKKKAELVERARAQELVFTLARRERDAWIGWPARVAATIAAELGSDARLVQETLDRHLRDHLAELAEIRVDLRAAGET